jgi:glucosyl-dolichyl phosphate glucuronosyltransferase
MNGNNQKVSAIICCYTLKRFQDTLEAIHSVLSQTLKPYEVIVSVDHNEELFQRLKDELPDDVKIVLNQGIVGSAETRNVGIRSAKGSIVAFLDDDAAAKDDWLEELIKPYSSDDVLVTGGRIISTWKDGRPPWFPEELDWIVGGTYKGYTETQSQVRNVLWPNMSFRRWVCDRVGYVKTDIGAIGNTSRSGDETELCMRIIHHIPGSKLVYCPEAIVYHKALPSHSNLRASIKRSFNEGKYKCIIKKSLDSLSEKSLSTENSYLKYLLFKSIPRRLRYFYKRGSLSQMWAIITCITSVGAGYLNGFFSKSSEGVKVAPANTKLEAGGKSSG